MDQRRVNALMVLCNELGVQCSNTTLFHQALTHTSFANEVKGIGTEHNERLEFLGDAVLDMVISTYLFGEFPNLPEGELTKARAQVVCEGTLACIGAEIGLGKYLLLGRGEANSGGRERTSILADATEALIGAIYLDQGFAVASEFVLKIFGPDLQTIRRGDYSHDYKTWLQEVVQKDNDSRICYEVIGEQGPDHNKVFEVMVFVNTIPCGRGTGKNKKEAEQQAAKQAIAKLNTK